MTKVRLRWLPAVAVPAAIAAGALVGPFQASAAATLPIKTPEQLLAMVGANTVKSLSGKLEQTSELGLPQLPTTGPSSNTGVASALDLLTGPHTARVYLAGPTDARVQVMDQLAERDVVRHGTDVWLYSSKDNSATHETLPAAGTDGRTAPSTPELQTPDQLAQRMLAAIDPGTEVTVGQDTVVAGRSAYDLVLSPRSSDTLVGSVSIAVDSLTGLPLSVGVQARGQDKPAFRLAFTDLILQAPSADLFTFTPPPGANVTQRSLPQQGDRLPPGQPGTPGEQSGSAASQHTVSGTGWDTVIGLPAAAVPAGLTASPLLAQAARTVDGGRLLSTALVNVLLTNDGRIFAGSVPLELLQAAAAAR
ncbi:LolA family protein [Arthrobacter sp. A5]|uniref:LolA family protein n=1 Tax=Arthrobacter sp. A5 TaxID=576926 RepID=UPI003DA7DE42